MPKFLFWNVNRKPVQDLIAAAANDLQIDILLLAECTSDPAALLTKLNFKATHYFLVRNMCPRIQIYTRFSTELIHPYAESQRYSISRLTLPARKEILIAAAHLPSKREFSAQSQGHECARLARAIVGAEAALGHQRTICIGDLNVNPFEDGVVSAGALHAVMTQETARRMERTVQGQRYSLFYNPMWSHFGDRVNPPGTFYYEKSEHLVYFWNIFDQVLLRPELADRFKHEDLHILTQIGSSSLLTNGKPDSKNASDHLPIMLNLEF